MLVEWNDLALIDILTDDKKNLCFRISPALKRINLGEISASNFFTIT